MRDANTRVWDITRHEVFTDSITGEPMGLAADVPSTVMEKGTAINYMDENGAWQDTDATIRASQSRGVVLEAVKQRAKLRFSILDSNNFNVEYDIDGGTLRTGVRTLELLNPETGKREVIATAQFSTPVADGNRAVYKGVFPGADIEYVNGNITFEQNLILHENSPLPDPASYGMVPASAMLVIVTEIDLSGTDADVVARTREGELNMRQTARADASVLEFRNAQGKAVHRFEAGTAWSGLAGAKRAASGGGIPVWKRFQWSDGKLFLLEGLRYSTLKEMQRPITIDYVMTVATSGKNEVWDPANTYWISAAFYVEDCTLVIEPGTVVKLGDADADNNEAIVINEGGTVIAAGEPYLPIFFTAYSDDGYGEDLDGGSGQPTEATPSRGSGNYLAALYFNSTDSNDSEVRFSRFRWAEDGIVAERSALNNEVRDCIFNNCDTAVRELTWVADDVVPGVDPRLDFVNNLVYECNNGAILSATTSSGDGGHSLSFEFNPKSNTFANCSGPGVYLDASLDADVVVLHIQAHNNIIALCASGFDSTSFQLNEADSAIDLDFNGFALLTGGSSSAYTGGFEFYGGSNGPPYQTTTPFDGHNGNGAYYLKQTSAFKDAGTGSQTALGVADKTTIAPYHVAATQAVSSASTWPKVGIDSATVDLGYHHPRVDWLIGDKATSVDAKVDVTAHLTVDPGVVVSAYRPSNSAIRPSLFFTGQTRKITAVGCATDYILWDSSYFLGTNFFNENSSTYSYHREWYGMYFDIDIYTATCYPVLKFCHFRHNECIQFYQDKLDGPIEHNIFEGGVHGVVLWHAKNSPTQAAAFRNNLVLDMYSTGVYAVGGYYDGDGAGATQIDLVNNTFSKCAKSVYINGSYNWSGFRVRAFRNIIVNCADYGIGANPSGYTAQQDLYLEPDGDNNIYWNNGSSPGNDVNASQMTIEGTVSAATNPLLVDGDAGGLSPDVSGYFLAKSGADVSRMPFAVSVVKQVTDEAITNLTNWPQGSWAVYVCGMTRPSDSAEVKAWFSVVNGALTYRAIEPDAALEGNLFVFVQRLPGSADDQPGAAGFDLKLCNDSKITVCLPQHDLYDMAEYGLRGYWVAQDGSTVHSATDHACHADWTYLVGQDARYAMRHDPEGLAQGAYAGGRVSPAAAVGGEGYIILPDGRNEIPTDAGFHYGDVQYGDGMAGALTPVNQSSEEKIHGMFIRSSLVRPSAAPEVRAVELGLSKSVLAEASLVTLRAHGAFFQSLEAFWDAECQTPVAWYQEVYWVDWWLDTTTPPATIFLRGSSSVSDVRGATLELAYKLATSTTEIQLATLPITVYAVGINYPGGIDDTEREVNWDDDGPHNYKSDRRDTGMTPQSTKSPDIGYDDDLVTAVINVFPQGLKYLLPNQEVTVAKEGQTDRGAIWDRPNRDRQVQGSYKLSDLPQTVTFEAVYPNTLDASGVTVNAVQVRASLKLGTSVSQDVMSVTQYLEANNTYYTIPHEIEYPTSTVNLPVRIGGPAVQATTTIQVNYDFHYDVGIGNMNGTGLLRNPVTAEYPPGTFTSYPYLKWQPQSQYYLSLTPHTGTNWQPNAQSTAKLWDASAPVGYEDAVSALDWHKTVTVPQLWHNIINHDSSLTWLEGVISLDRYIDDTGSGPPNPIEPTAKWMDIFVPFVDPAARTSYQSETMRKICSHLQPNTSIRVHWSP